MHGLLLVTQKPQSRRVHNKEYVPTFWWHVEEFEFSAVVAGRQDNAGKQAEWLTYWNALRALPAQVTPPALGSRANILIPSLEIPATYPSGCR